MAAKAANEREWSRKVATAVTESLLFPKLIGWKSFEPALDVAIDTIHGWLTKRDYPAGDKDHADNAWTEKVGRSIVEALVKAGLVTAADEPRALELAQEEILVSLMLGDPPPQQS